MKIKRFGGFSTPKSLEFLYEPLIFLQKHYTRSVDLLADETCVLDAQGNEAENSTADEYFGCIAFDNSPDTCVVYY